VADQLLHRPRNFSIPETSPFLISPKPGKLRIKSMHPFFTDGILGKETGGSSPSLLIPRHAMATIL
jgi:hypothetical protein